MVPLVSVLGAVNAVKHFKQSQDVVNVGLMFGLFSLWTNIDSVFTGFVGSGGSKLTLVLPGPNISVFKQILDQYIQLELLKNFVIDA